MSDAAEDRRRLTRSNTQRNAARQRKLAALTDRNTVLEDTLRDVWVWLATDAIDTNRLRDILITADRDHQIHAALDRLIEGSTHVRH